MEDCFFVSKVTRTRPTTSLKMSSLFFKFIGKTLTYFFCYFKLLEQLRPRKHLLLAASKEIVD